MDKPTDGELPFSVRGGTKIQRSNGVLYRKAVSYLIDIHFSSKSNFSGGVCGAPLVSVRFSQAFPASFKKKLDMRCGSR